MPQTLDFNTITYDTITIISQDGERRWVLRDDVPMAILVRVFGLQALGERIAERAKALDPQRATAAEAQAIMESVLAESAAEALSVLGAIFRHTDPTVTDEELAAAFTYEQQGAIINLFFSHRLGSLSTPSNATASGGETTATEAEMEQALAAMTAQAPARRRGGQRATSPAKTRRTR